MSVGSSASFEAFVHARGRALLRTATLMCGDVHAAEDLVQEALLRASRRWDRIDDPEGYLRQALARGAIDRWRKLRREVLVLSVPDRAAPAAVDDSDLLAALAALPARQRVAVVLRYLHELPVSATADVMGCSEGTVKTHCHRGLAALRRTLTTELVHD